MAKLTAPNLSPKQLNALTALAAGNSVTDAAKAADVHRSTLYLWSRDLPEFRQALDQARRRHAEAMQDRVLELAESALDTIRHLLEDPSSPPSVRLRAALAVIQQAEVVRKTACDVQAGPTQAPPQNEPKLESPHETPIARNASCPCGSGLKYKRCCGTQPQPVLHAIADPHLDAFATLPR